MSNVGDGDVTPVACVLAVQSIQKRHAWFARIVSDIRMLRMEERNDLMPAIGEPALELGRPPGEAG